MSLTLKPRGALVLARLVFAVALVAGCGRAAATVDEKTFVARRDASYTNFAKRDLPREQAAQGWVDSERWCVAHSCMARGERLEEANAFFASSKPVSVTRGLIADSDIQIVSLLRSYFQFKDDPKLSAEGKAGLLRFFKEWKVPNTDRNGDADTRYFWPHEYTENHSLAILTGFYLSDVATGRDRALRRSLLERFLRDRARYGWSEFHSPQYGRATTMSLFTLTDYAPDPSIAEGAKILLDLLTFELVNQSAGWYRGVPFVRGAGAETNNANSYHEILRLWWSPAAENADGSGDAFAIHQLASKYRPPAEAFALLNDLKKRGRYAFYQTGTTGNSRLRVPIVVWVSPEATIASAQGYGHYYRGCYWSISFASDASNVVTGRYGEQSRNILQVRNVLATFGDVKWHGHLAPKREGNIAVGGDAATYVGQIDVTDEIHLLTVAPVSDYADAIAFRKSLEAMKPKWENGTLSWTMPAIPNINGGGPAAAGGTEIKMVNQPVGGRWALVSASEAGRPITIDRNNLYESPWIRSVRSTGVTELLAPQGGKLIYDYSDPAKPGVSRKSDNMLTPAAPESLPTVSSAPGMELVYVPAGEFPMGASAGEGRPNERPTRWVDLPGFYISKTEVTVAQYKQFLSETSSAAKPPEWFYKEWGKTDQYPMTWVTWTEAKAYCDWLSKKTGWKFRLPTEAEWEKAAKGFTHRAYPWGNFYDGSQAGTPNTTYIPVATKPTDVSPFGVLDMAGNVWEWCADWYDIDAYHNARQTDEPLASPKGPANGTRRSLRGCGWNFDPDTFRCSFRSSFEPEERAVHIGFRVVREP